MKSIFRIGSYSGIDIFAHWTFPVMLAGVFGFYVWQGLTVFAALAGVTLIVTVFGCVVLHEIGHAMMARRFGIPTLDIVMYPIGGVARLKRMPREPLQEFLIAIAGPAVNLAIAGVLYFFGQAFGVTSSIESFGPSGQIITTLMWINLGLVVFNLLPAFPMDGGRILRAALASQMEYRTATHLAGFLGMGLAGVFGIYGLAAGIWSLPLVAVFVFMAARREVQVVMEQT